MFDWKDVKGPATWGIMLILFVIVGVGGAVVIIDAAAGKGGYTFAAYVDDLKALALAVAALAGARAVHLGASRLADAHEFKQDVAGDPDPDGEEPDFTADELRKPGGTPLSAHTHLKG